MALAIPRFVSSRCTLRASASTTSFSTSEGVIAAPLSEPPCAGSMTTRNRGVDGGLGCAAGVGACGGAGAVAAGGGGGGGAAATMMVLPPSAKLACSGAVAVTLSSANPSCSEKVAPVIVESLKLKVSCPLEATGSRRKVKRTPPGSVAIVGFTGEGKL